MRPLSRSQKIYAGILLGMLVLCLLLKLGLPVYEYIHGKDALTTLLEQVATVLGFAVIAIGFSYTILQRIGVLPTVTPSGAPPANGGMKHLRNLALWVVIAILLMFLFNLSQTGGRPHRLDNPTVTLIVQYLPVALIVLIWIFFALRMNAKKKKDLGGNS